MKQGMILAAVAVAAIGGAMLAQTSAADPWAAADLISPEVLAKKIGDKTRPTVLYVGFPVLYRGAHIPGAILAGPGSKPEGLELLKRSLAGISKDQEVVLYCGCCPWDRCPNVRPAFALVKQLGYTKAKLVTIPTNVHTDWIQKGYPVERPAGQAEKP